jgi:signal transduction histidine kinase
MKSTNRTIFIVSADPVVTRECIQELVARGGRYPLPIAGSVEQARRAFRDTPPAAIFLDESAVDPDQAGVSLESAVARLVETAPVVVAAAPERQGELSFLITSGAVDFVARANQFIPIAAGLLERRVRLVRRAGQMIQFPADELAGDFGEILRHEVNNPLTGILGNTELLLARRDRLPPAAVARLQVIADLAVRLRETVRRLSNAWDEHHEHVHPA